MLALISILLTINLATAIPLNHGSNHTSNHISNYPYTIAIFQPALSDFSNTPFICSGVLLTTTTVLTIAECVSGLEAADISIRTGTTPTTYQNIPVSEITTHSDYNVNTLANDIAVIYLAKVVIDTTPAVLSTETSIPTGANVTAVSWGSASNDTQAISNAPKHSHLVVMDSDTCAKKLSSSGYQLDTEQHFCTGITDEGQAYGDGGGPVVEEGKLVGLVSGNPSCADSEGVALQVRLAGFEKWIQKMTV